MGVQGLWSLVSPAARPTPLESLRRKRLAVDASIWIHQFMRTMRDKEGNALRNGHLLGFFRRLCKLLFFDIKPVFVFDGGAPFLKRSTIKERRQRREGMKANLKVTAKKIFNAQVKSRMLLQHEKKLQAEEKLMQGDATADTPTEEEENYVYVEELEQKAAVEALRKKRKLDQYELPEIDTAHHDTYATITKNNTLDPRLATKEEIQNFVNDFAPSINAMDIDNDAFQALPLEVQYEIIQDLKWKSRSTSHARLEDMVKKSETAMDFSKQQIQNLQHRNEMTQRLMQVSGMAHLVEPTRVASERGKQYILSKNENIKEGLGWTLPGLNASTPVELDPLPSSESQLKEDSIKTETVSNKAFQRSEPKLVVPVTADFAPTNTEESVETDLSEGDQEVDPVAAALSAKPELAALMNGLLDSDIEEDVQEDTVKLNEDEPLFVSQAINQPSQDMADTVYHHQPQEQPQQQTIGNNLTNNMAAYGRNDPEAVNQVLSRIYSNVQDKNVPIYHHQQQPIPQQYVHNEPEVGAEMNEEELYYGYLASLSPQQLYESWLSRAPPAFIYMNSINDAYKSILRTIIEEEDLDKLHEKLRSVRRQRSKTNADHDMTLESLRFQIHLIKEVILWRELQQSEELITSSEEDDFEDITPEGKQQQQQEYVPSMSANLTPEEDSNIAEVVQQKQDTENVTTSVSDVDQPAAAIIASKTIDESMIITDDEDDEDIQFTEVPASTSMIDASKNTKKENLKNEPTSTLSADQNTQHVHINIEQSSLFQKKTETLSGAGATFQQEEAVDASADTISSSDKDTPIDHTVHIPVTVVSKTDVSHSEKLQDQSPSPAPAGNEAKIATFPVKEEKVTEKDVTATTTTSTTTTVMNESEMAAEEQGYNSEEELVNTMQGEEAEYLRFVSDIATKHLDDIKQDLQQEMKQLNALQRKTMGNTDDITDQMVQDTQELLRLFGIPYLIAPMEAEAQCAKLEELNLVDGTITDDSDVFLFGAKRVYKNVFNQQKYVECYLNQDIEREMLLTRKKLIQLAYLLGSDYTEGIPGVGPVAAMEILNEFSTEKDLEDEAPIEAALVRFKKWYESNKDETPFQKRFRKRHNALDIPDDFPNLAVVKAYFHPTVDDSTDQFVWGQPELESLRVFLMESFSWSEEKADQVLLPVLREMNSRKTTGEQSVITSHYFADSRIISSSNTAKHSSKRVRSIVENWRKQKKSRK